MPRVELHLPPLADIAQLDDAAFRAFFAGTAIKRSGRGRLLRNVAIAMANSGDTALLPAARKDGAAHAAVGPERSAMALGGALALGAGLAPWWLAGGAPGLCVAAVALACGAALGMVYLSHRQIRGQTGDVAGAAQQVAEITFLIALCIRV
jgi:cobalamin synthase